MIEKHKEHGLDLGVFFTDFKQALDSVNRKRLFEAMDKMGITQKLIRLTRMAMCQKKARVRTDNQISVSFEINKGVKQGDGLSTSLFVLALHNAAQEIVQKGTIYTKSSQICAYTDDVVIVTRSETRLRQVYREIEENPQGMGLILNEKKAKFMMVSATQKGRQTQNWKVGDKVFERGSSFKYLGNVINEYGRISECINDRTQVGRRAYAAKYLMLESKIIRRSVKMQICKTLIRPVVRYGSETWTLTKSYEKMSRIFERKIL